MALKPIVTEAGWQSFYVRAVMFDLVDDELRHQSVCDELDPTFVHLGEELLAVGVDEAHVCQVDDGWEWFLARDRALPAFLEFGDTGPGQPTLDEELNVAINDSSGDS